MKIFQKSNKFLDYGDENQKKGGINSEKYVLFRRNINVSSCFPAVTALCGKYT